MEREADFIWIVVAPGGAANAPLAREAARAGAWGFVDLEDLREPEAIGRALRGVEAGIGPRVGVKLDASARPAWERWIPRIAAAAPRVILSRPEDSPSALAATVGTLQRHEVQVLVEAVGVDEAMRAQQAGADGIIAKGSEAGGRIGDETAFLLIQRLSGLLSKPVYAHGGIGLHTAAAVRVAGARGAVLDWQLALLEESQLDAPSRQLVSRLDGSETASVGLRLGDGYRLYTGPRRGALQDLQQAEHRLVTAAGLSDDERVARWREEVDQALARPSGEVQKVGMDVSFAARLAERFRTVGGLLEGLDRSLRYHCARARESRPFAPGMGVAGLLGIQYPLVQGPMSRVSDTPAFAAAVAEAGGLPVMAVAAMRADELEPMLRDTCARLGDSPWGAGLLGFLPPELYGAQVALVKKYRPPTAIIAGGRPVQAGELEAEGIRTWIHVPSHRLLDLYMDDGTRNMIFEGLECGGHIGRYSAFVLWENAIEVLLDRLPRASTRHAYSVLFAGGISTALSAAMVSALAAPLADRGIDVGMLAGTAYLFTREAVECGAINHGFQETVLEARRTAILDCGGGYQIRAAPSPFCDAFEEEKQRLIDEGKPAEEVRMSLEHLTLGRLRVAAKGLRFNEEHRQDPTQPLTVDVPEAEQLRDGVYMAGQAILIQDRICSVEDLHRRLSEESGRVLRDALAKEPRLTTVSGDGCPIAIVGMSALFPGAPDAPSYWENILAKHYSITEVPAERWDVGAYFDPQVQARDKVYSRWGGFLEAIEFDALKFGIPPKSVGSIDPMQLITLEIVDRALRDAGYHGREFDRERTSVFVGEGGGMGNLAQLYSLRSLLPMVMEKVPEEILAQLPEWTTDSFPGLLPNVIAGRIANQYDLGGTNLSTSAACAAGLAALALGMDELRAGKSRVSIVASVDLQQNPFIYLCFSKTMALSPTGTPRCFDAAGDGIVISQGVGAVILKRLEDAERDGDRIYAVLRGVGSSSDGRGKSLTAPTPTGQLRAMRRAYEQAGISPATLDLIEAHGTGTVLGDRTEAESITLALREAGAAQRSCAVGTVKSMIGHTKGCAGIAGLIKVALALHHRVLPPTMGVQRPATPELWTRESPAYLNTEPRPWVASDHPRRAAVSSFGFGGTNFHAVLEEHQAGIGEAGRFPTSRLPAEVIALRRGSYQELLTDLDALDREAQAGSSLHDLAYRAHQAARGGDGEARLALVTESIEDLQKKIQRIRDRLGSSPEAIHDPTGIYFTPSPLARQGKIAFVFPGQGSQRVDMLKDLVLLFEELRESLAIADRTLAARLGHRLSDLVYPPAAFSDEERAAQMEALTRTDVTQPALGVVGYGMAKVLEAFGIVPEMTAGHSVGEYVALCVAGVYPEDSLYPLLWARGASMLRAGGEDAGTMMAVRGEPAALEETLAGHPEIYAANFNAPLQTVVSGRKESLERLAADLGARDIQARFIPVGCGFHSPFVAEAAQEFAGHLAEVPYAAPRLSVYSNYLAAPFPDGSAAVRETLAAHLSNPVRFVEEVRRMHEDGARVFVEVGPGKVCSGLIGEILAGRPHATIPCDGAASRSGTVRFLHAVAQLFAQGAPVRLDPLFVRRLPAEDQVAARGRPGARARLITMVSPEVSWPASGQRPRITPVRAPVPADPPVTAPPRATPVAPVAPPVADRPVAAPPAPPTAAAPPGPSPAHPAPTTPRPAAAGPAAPVVPPAGGPGMPIHGPLADVVLKHQRLMAAFLEQQGEVMAAYLRGQAGRSGAAAASTGMPVGAGTPTTPVVAAAPVAPPPVVPTAPHPLAAPVTPAPSAPAAQAAPAPAAPAPPAAAQAPAPAAPAVSLDHLQTQLLELVAERTGYPTDMLALDQDLEADLGIDSIKRVEILTTYARQFPDLGAAVAEELRAARTLGDVLDIMRRSLAAQAAAAPPAPAQEPGTPEGPEVVVDRYVIRMRDATLPDGALPAIPAGAILITDDGAGAAVALRERLRSLGGHPVVVRLEGDDAPAEGVYVADLASPIQVEQLVQRVRRDQGPIGGVVHLLPLRSVPAVPDLSGAAFQRLVDEEVKGLFYLLQQAADDLKSTRGIWALACLSFGGTPENGSLPVPDRPWRGGVIGVLKTVRVEWPEAVVRSLVLEEPSPQDIPGQILMEIGAPADEIEAYYRGGNRRVPAPITQPVDTTAGAVDLRPEDVVVLIGGARGITAEVALEIARHARPTLVLVGRSAWPGEESSATAAAASDPELRRALFAEMQAQGRRPSPLELDRAARRIQMDREMRAARAAMQAAGSRVHYHQADIRDEGSTEALFRALYDTHGRVDGVICGAGIIEDKLIEDKAPESFDRVFDTKARAAFHLARALRPETLKFFVIFSSVAGWTGNRGQVDYVAANEVLNRMALHLSTRWNRRVVAIDWGPWEKAGMVTPEIRRQFLERGVGLVPPDAGRRFLLDEIRFGSLGDPVVAALGRLQGRPVTETAGPQAASAGGSVSR